jgi:hypothetical protein
LYDEPKRRGAKEPMAITAFSQRNKGNIVYAVFVQTHNEVNPVTERYSAYDALMDIQAWKKQRPDLNYFILPKVKPAYERQH